MSGPDYSRAGANRDRPTLIPASGPVLRRALEGHGFIWRAPQSTLIGGDGGSLVFVTIGTGLQLNNRVLSATGGASPTMSYFPATYAGP